ncbi:hypothetical protein DL768_001762 [Monosporascus sp. mg162]|nr:hypothetical protein DL768_001762 [Monosporascus sp. mg162]
MDVVQEKSELATRICDQVTKDFMVMERAITGCINLMVIHGTFGRPGGCVSKASFFQAQPLERIEQMELTYTTGAFTDKGAAYLRTPTRNSRYEVLQKALIKHCTTCSKGALCTESTMPDWKYPHQSKRTAAWIDALAAEGLAASSLELYTLRRESGLRRRYDEDLDGANNEMSSERLMMGLFYHKIWAVVKVDESKPLRSGLPLGDLYPTMSNFNRSEWNVTLETEAARRIRRGVHGPQFQAEHFRQLDHRPAIDYRKPFWTELYIKPLDDSGLADEEISSSDSEDDCNIPAAFFRLNSGGKTTANRNNRRQKPGAGDIKSQEN